MWLKTTGSNLIAFGLAMLGLVGCATQPSTVRGKVVDESGAAIPHASVYVYSTKGTPLDRNSFIYECATDNLGMYTIAYSGRLEAVFAAAEGYNPSYSRSGRTLTLPTEPQLPLAVRKVTLKVSTDAPVAGLDFDSASVVAPGQADLVARYLPGSPAGVELIAGGGTTYFRAGPDLPHSYAAMACDFHNMRHQSGRGPRGPNESLSPSDLWIAHREDGEPLAKLWAQETTLSIDGRKAEISLLWASAPGSASTLRSRMSREELVRLLPSSNWRVVP